MLETLNCAVVSSVSESKGMVITITKLLEAGCWIHLLVPHEWQKFSEDPFKGEEWKENRGSLGTRVSARLWQCFSQQVGASPGQVRHQTGTGFCREFQGGDARRPGFGREVHALKCLSPPRGIWQSQPSGASSTASGRPDWHSGQALLARWTNRWQ